MKSFFHTIVFTRNILNEELEDIFKLNNERIYKKPYGYIITEFNREGIRINIVKRTNEEIKYDKEHKCWCIKVLITPYKVVHNDCEIGYLINWDAYELVYDIVEKRLIEILGDYGYLDNWKLSMVDITKDIVTPSHKYTNEIIATLKATKLSYGYNAFVPSEEQIKKYDWNEKESYYYSNEKQGVSVKVYNKTYEMSTRGKSEYTENDKGRIRFELSLNKKFLNKKGFSKKDESKVDKRHIRILNKIYNNRDRLLYEYVVDNLNTGSMLSANIQEKYIKKMYSTKESRREKMNRLSKSYEQSKKRGDEMEFELYAYSRKEYNTVINHYETINISPIPLDNSIPYIPSVEDLFYEQYDSKLRNFVQKKTRKKEIWTYE